MSSPSTPVASSPEPTSEPSARAPRRRSVRIALAVSLAVIALLLALTLSGSPTKVVGTDSIPALAAVGYIHGGAEGCQPAGTVPGGTTAVRLALGANVGPRLSVRVLSGGHVVAHGQRPAGWGVLETVTVPISRVPRTVPNAEICVALGGTTEPIEVRGANLRAQAPGTPKRLFRAEYLQAASSSWWSRLSSIATRMGWGHAASGTWIVFLELALVLAVIAITVRALLLMGDADDSDPDRRGGGVARQKAAALGSSAGAALAGLGARVRGRGQRTGKPGSRPAASKGSPKASTPRSPAQPPQSGARAWASRLGRWASAAGAALLRLVRRVPRLAWFCVLVAFLNAACWSLLTPPFQVPDEPSHFAYAQYVAEAGALPHENSDRWSEEEIAVLKALHHREVRGSPEHEAITSSAEQELLENTLNEPLSRVGEGGAGVASSQPPLYYAAEAVPYFLGSWGSILDRLELMRLLSALMAGVTALFGYLFVREALPRVPWAWTVGGLGIALVPLLGFMSGAVNPEAMFVAVAALGFFLIARAFRRGLTPALAIGIGVTIALGTLTKLNFLGLVPGMLVALVVLSVRAAGGLREIVSDFRPRAPVLARYLGIGLGAAIIPGLAYVLINVARGHPVLGSASAVLHPTGGHGTIFDEAGYIWQFYLPRLPGMSTDFHGVSPLAAIWFNRSVGLYGWLDTAFPQWLYDVALVPLVALLGLGIRSLVVNRRALPSRLGEGVSYALMFLGMLVLIGSASYQHFPEQAGTYGEPRYLLPLLPLAGAWLALSARGAGRRFGPATGVVIVMLFVGWNLASQLQLIARFYS
jgi:hypothetical protein